MEAPSSTRWNHSSKRTPCQVCHRDTDGKCRWRDGLILCHQGDTFNPPSLKPGEVLQIEGQPWAVVSLKAGFSGMAMALRPHVDRHAFKPTQRRIRRRMVASLTPKLAKHLVRAREWVQACLGMPNFEGLTLVELEQELALARDAAKALQALKKPLLAAKREDPAAMGRWLQAVCIWQKLVGYQLRDIETFFRVTLGTPTPEQISSLEVA